MKNIPSPEEVKLGPVEITDGIRVVVGTDAGRTAVAEYLEEEGLGITSFRDSYVRRPLLPDEEPVHEESPLMVDPLSLDERELGTWFDQTLATYAGWVADLDSQPTSQLNDDKPQPLAFRHQLPTEPMSWGIEPRS